jgi:sugar lactone lactonase YvrE
MGYDPIDTDETDSNADKEITVDAINGADTSAAAAGEALLSDGSGNLTFGSGGGGILRNGSDIDYVALDVSNLPASTGSGDVALVTASDQYVEDNPLSGTAFDITSSEFSLDTSISTQDSSPQGIAWNNDGSRLYEVGTGGGGDIYEYTVSAPFDINSASFSTSINSQFQGPLGIAWNNDGSRLYEVDEFNEEIYQYNVSTPFDISSASVSTSINTQDGVATGIEWNDDGSRLYEVGSTGDKIYQYTVSTPFDITTASFSTSINTQDGFPQGIAWNNDGSALYEVTNSADEIYQYTVTTGGWEAF